MVLPTAFLRHKELFEKATGWSFKWKMYVATSSEDADNYIAGLSFAIDFNPFYKALKDLSQILYDAMQGLSFAWLSDKWPIRITIPNTRVSWEIVSATGTVPNFVLPDITIPPSTICLKMKVFGLKWVVFYPDITVVDLPVTGSENLYYTIDGTYGLGTSWDPDHQMTYQELTTDAILLGLIFGIIYVLKQLSMEDVAKEVSSQALKISSSWSINTKLDDINDTVDSNATDLVSILADTSNIINKVNNIITMVDGDSEIITKLNEIKDLIGLRLRL